MIQKLDNPLGHTMDLSSQSLTSLSKTSMSSDTGAVARADPVSVLVFSHDAELANTIRSLSGVQLSARVINEWQDLLAMVAADQGRIVLLDVDALTLPVDKALADLNSRAGWLVVVIATKQSQAQEFMRFWSERKIHRLLIKPAAVGITRLLLESAIGRYFELRERDQAAGDDVVATRVPTRPPLGLRKTVLVRLAVSGLALVGIGVAAFLLFPGLMTGGTSDLDPVPGGAGPRQLVRDEADSTSQLRGAVPARPMEQSANEFARATIPDEFAEQLTAAADAVAAGRLVDPPGQSALDFYLQVLDLAPSHPVATTELSKLIERLFSIAEGSLLEGEFDDAQALLTQIARAVPEGSRLRFLQEQLSRSRQERQASAQPGVQTLAEPLATGSGRPAQASVDAAIDSLAVTELVSDVRERISQGFLLEPAGDSARDKLDLAASLAPNSAEILDLRMDLVDALTSSARLLIEAEALSAAEQMLTAASDLGAAADVLAALNAELLAVEASQRLAMLESLSDGAAARIQEGWLVEPQDGSAFTLMSELRSRAPDYNALVALDAAFADAATPRAQDAIEAQEWEAAELLLQALAQLPTAIAELGDLQTQIEFARQQAQFFEVAAPISELVQVETAAPVYPRTALQNDITGWVDVEFIVDSDGLPRDIAVVDAQPLGRFENSAIAAVEDYRFEPFERDGFIYQRRVRVRIRYQLE